MILFRSVKDERFIVKMAGVLCFSNIMFRQCGVSHIECVAIRNVISVPFFPLCTFGLTFRGSVFSLVVFGIQTVTSFAVVIICSIPRCQLALALLMRQRATCVHGIRSSLFDGGVVVLWSRYSVVVRVSRSARCCDAC